MFMSVRSLESRSDFRHRSHRLISFLVWGFMLSFIGTQGVAEDSPEAAPRPTERFLDDEAVVVLEIDLEAILPREAVQWVAEAGIMSDPLPARVIAMLELTHASLQAAGARDIVVMVTLRDVVHGSLLLIPCEETESLLASPRQWVEDVDAISLHWRFPPEVALELRVIPRDDGATDRVAESLRHVISFVAGLAGQDLDAERDEPDETPVEIQVGQLEVTATIGGEFLISLLSQLPLDGALERTSATNRLEQIGFAILRHFDNHQFLPPRATVTPEGEGLLSWRVHLLPYLDQQALHQEFQLDEPWDGPTNRRWGEVVVPDFVIPGDSLPPGHTRIRFPVLEGSLWHGEGPPRGLADVTDGTSNTIAAALAPPDQSVPWTQPEAWQLDEADLIDSFFGEAEETLVLVLDGSVRVLPRTMAPATLRAMLTHAGG